MAEPLPAPGETSLGIMNFLLTMIATYMEITFKSPDKAKMMTPHGRYVLAAKENRAQQVTAR